MGSSSSTLSEYSYGNGFQTVDYVPGQHPGALLLPPKAIMGYKSLPESIKGQIFDERQYDSYGKRGWAFEDSYIDRPQGKAKRDYEQWLTKNKDIAEKVDKYIKKRLDFLEFKLLKEKELEEGDLKEYTEWGQELTSKY